MSLSSAAPHGERARWAWSGKTSDPVGPLKRTSRSLGQSDRASAPVTSGHSGGRQWSSQDGGDQVGQERLAGRAAEVCRARVLRGRSLSSTATASSPRTVDAVRILVASSRPRACGVTEVDEHAGDARQGAMATHLDTLESQVGDHRRCAGKSLVATITAVEICSALRPSRRWTSSRKTLLRSPSVAVDERFFRPSRGRLPRNRRRDAHQSRRAARRSSSSARQNA